MRRQKSGELLVRCQLSLVVAAVAVAALLQSTVSLQTQRDSHTGRLAFARCHM